jgi:hypothetical protein
MGRPPRTRSQGKCAMRHAAVSRRRPQRGGDLAPAIEATEPDLPADHKAEEEDQRGILGGQRALGLHAPTKLLVQPVPRQNLIPQPSG